MPSERWPTDPALLQTIREDWHPRWGDRKQELVVIGRSSAMDRAALEARFAGALLDEQPAVDAIARAADGRLGAVAPAVQSDELTLRRCERGAAPEERGRVRGREPRVRGLACVFGDVATGDAHAAPALEPQRSAKEREAERVAHRELAGAGGPQDREQAHAAEFGPFVPNGRSERPVRPLELFAR
jgi:hypothetical protein